jgi:hypothetical protein
MLDAGAYSQLARTGSDISIKAYASVQRDLFERIERESTGSPAEPTEE